LNVHSAKAFRKCRGRKLCVHPVELWDGLWTTEEKGCAQTDRSKVACFSLRPRRSFAVSRVKVFKAFNRKGRGGSQRAQRNPKELESNPSRGGFHKLGLPNTASGADFHS